MYQSLVFQERFFNDGAKPKTKETTGSTNIAGKSAVK